MHFKYLNIVCFSILIAIILIIDVLGPMEGFSALENRYLSEKPSFSLQGFANGDYTMAYEKYVKDQFVAREAWMRAKSFFSHTLGKVENNNVVFGKEGYLFHKFIHLPDQFHKNLAHLSAFAQRHPSIPTTLLLAPNSYAVMEDFLPIGLYNVDQKPIIEQAYAFLADAGFIGLDVLTALLSNKEEALYYKLDHHWTTQGAYVAYLAWCNQKGIEPTELEDWTAQHIEGFKGTFYSAAKRFDALKDEITYYEMPHATVTMNDNLVGGLYDLSYAAGKDKYGLFLYNNPSRLTIKSTHENAKGSLLVIKDSYANSFLPFLTVHYEEVEVIDLRTFNGDVDALVLEGQYDEALFLYNVISFSENFYLSKLK